MTTFLVIAAFLAVFALLLWWLDRGGGDWE